MVRNDRYQNIAKSSSKVYRRKRVLPKGLQNYNADFKNSQESVMPY